MYSSGRGRRISKQLTGEGPGRGWRTRPLRNQLRLIWVLLWSAVSLYLLFLLSSQAAEKRREALASICDERARMLQDQFNHTANHLLSLAITVSTFHHSKTPSAIDQTTFAMYAKRTAFERPLTSGVAYAVKVMHAEREQFERQQGWSIKKMYSSKKKSSPGPGNAASSEIQEAAEEYAPVIFAQDAYKHVVSFDMLSGSEDRKHILRARASGKGVLTAPCMRLNNRLGVILTYTVYKSELPPNAKPQERIQAAIGYVGAIIDVEALVDKLLHQLAWKQSIMVNVYDTTNNDTPINMYGPEDTGSGMCHVSTLNFSDPSRSHAMHCRFRQKPPWPWLAITSSLGTLVIALLTGHTFHATIKWVAKVEDNFQEKIELKKQEEVADVAKSQFLATDSHVIRTPMNGVVGDRSIPLLVPDQAEQLCILRMDSIHKELSVLQHMLERSEKPSNISLSILKYITNDFSEEWKIGKGGCGEVYKGVLPNGHIVAVKKLFNKHTIDDKQFNQEFQSMIMAEHENIVRFIGYCSHTEQKAMKIEGKFIMAEMRERLLCFEYISNGSLDNYLTDELRGLQWCTRYKIIKGICEGLHYLHKEKHIIHMDLKPANILVDDHMVPKITDFGVSRLAELSHTLSNDRLCSPQYCAPEYRHHGKMSLKSDIYSLGVIIIELVTGSREEPCTTNVLRRWWHRWNKSSKHLSEFKQVNASIQLALRCMHKDPAERPFIWDIVNELNQTENANSNDNAVDQITSCFEDMLEIEPLELHFPYEPNTNISCALQLTNSTDDYFAFRIEMIKSLQFCILPIKDVVPPRSKYSVTVMAQTRNQAPEHEHSKDEFTVQSTRVDGGLIAMGTTEDLFSVKRTGKIIDNVHVTIVFDTPLPEESKEDSSAMPRIGLDEVVPQYQEGGNRSNEPQLNATKEGTSAQVQRQLLRRRISRKSAEL